MISITITDSNAHTFFDIQPGCTRIIWQANVAKAVILRNFVNLEVLIWLGTDSPFLKELEWCPKLKKLNCSRGGLTSLAGLRFCPLLEQLNCSRNYIESLEGLELCPLLQKLDCSHNGLWSLSVLAALPKLTSLVCSSNHISCLNGLQHCPLLQELYCAHNNIFKLTELRGCLKLQVLDCAQNYIDSLAGIENCRQLHKLEFLSNRLTSLTGIEELGQLQTLSCRKNQVVCLVDMTKLARLHFFDCSKNRLVSLAGLETCERLEELRIQSNKLKTLEQIVYLRYLRKIWYDTNPLDIQSIQVTRLLKRLNNPRNQIKGVTVYGDSQNVHNLYIQKTVCESIQRLLHDPKPEFSIEMLIDLGLDERAIRLLLEYCGDDSMHSVHLLTYSELLAYVWARIRRSEHKDELIRILGEQVTDAECKCFTGRFTRTLSVLVGFYPDIVIAISESSQISSIIITAGAKIEPYDSVAHRALAEELLTSAGHDANTIQPWLEAISEP